jgi:hypothetical protein
MMKIEMEHRNDEGSVIDVYVRFSDMSLRWLTIADYNGLTGGDYNASKEAA